MVHVNVFVAKLNQPHSGRVGQFLDPLDRMDFTGDLGKDCSRISGARADLEYLFAALQSQCFGHQCHDVRLGDGLLGLDGQRRIFISEFPHRIWKKQLPGNFSNGLEHRCRAHASSGDLLLDHRSANLVKTDHWPKILGATKVIKRCEATLGLNNWPEIVRCQLRLIRRESIPAEND